MGKEVTGAGEAGLEERAEKAGRTKDGSIAYEAKGIGAEGGGAYLSARLEGFVDG